MLGRLQMDDMARAYGRSQVVIVPTNATFAEGMNRVCIEAILAHRPLITSRACPAIEVLSDAVLEVPVGDTGAYSRAYRLSRTIPVSIIAYRSRRRSMSHPSMIARRDTVPVCIAPSQSFLPAHRFRHNPPSDR